MSGPSIYHDLDKMKDIVASGEHRRVIGGMWDEIGALQLSFLKENGLKPQHRLLDIGCGSLRFGVKASAYLEAGKYWGTDMCVPLMQAGYGKEIVPLSLQDKLPAHHLVEDAEFSFHGLPDDFDFVIANSVFTHLPLNDLRLCLFRLGRHLKSPSRFFFTVFMPDKDCEPGKRNPQQDGIFTFSHKDPFHYDLEDILHANRGLPWKIRLVGDWKHPRNQKMIEARMN